MARCGVDSRRKCEELISHGQVEINGETVRELGVKIDPTRDRVRVNGKVLRLEEPSYYIHYKVKGVTTTVSDDLGRKTVMDCLPGIRERVYPVGRLDKETEGLLVFTNDGDLANYLTQPAHGVAKTYRVVAEGRIPEDTIRTLAEKGMRLGPVLVKPSRVKLVRYDNDNTVVEISVTEGMNREVRRIFAGLGHEVKKLLRIQLGPLTLDGMKRGGTRPLTPREVKILKKGMEGANMEDEAALFPPGSAKSRRPTGPRGRPRREAAPRRGKPDPAQNAPRPGPRTGKGKVVVDDWEKGAKPSGRRRNAPAAPAPTSAVSKRSGPLRPKSRGKPAADSAFKPDAKPRPKASSRPTKAPKTVRHPLAVKPPAAKK